MITLLPPASLAKRKRMTPVGLPQGFLMSKNRPKIPKKSLKPPCHILQTVVKLKRYLDAGVGPTEETARKSSFNSVKKFKGKE